MLRALQHPVNSHLCTYMHLFPGVVDTFSNTHTVRDTLVGSYTISEEEEESTAPAVSRPWLKPNEYYRGASEVTIYKNLELSLGREIWRLDLSPPHISLGRLFPTGLHCQGRKHAGTPKSVCMKLEASGCGCLCEVVGDWDVNYPIQNGDSGLRTMTL